MLTRKQLCRLCSICNNYEFKIIMWWNKGFRWMLRENWQLKSPATDIYMLVELKWPLRTLGHWWRKAAHLVDLHSLLQGPGLRVGGSEDPELSLDQGAVGQVHPADVKVDHSVVRVGGCWLYHIWMEELEKNKNKPELKQWGTIPRRLVFWKMLYHCTFILVQWCIVSDIITADMCLQTKS